MDLIDCLDFHETRVFVTEFSDVGVFYRLNYLDLEYLAHDGIIFIGL